MRAWRRPVLLAASVACQIALSGVVAAAEFSGYLGAEGRWFPARPVDPEQAGETASLVFQPEAYVRWDGGSQALAVVLFARVDGDRARYESEAGRDHVDLAVRWSQSIGPWDIGLAHFRGTSREPRFLPALDPSGEPMLLPFYEQIDQTSLNLQATTGPWLLKLEALTRRDRLERFAAPTGGFEYTFGDVAGSGIDIGILTEYLYDDRGRRATTPFEDDVFVGTRVVFNDVQSTDLLAGTIIDLDHGGTVLSLEGNRRLGERWRLRLEARGSEGFPSADPLHAFRRDHSLQAEPLWNF